MGQEVISRSVPGRSLSFRRAVISLRVVATWARRESEVCGVNSASEMVEEVEVEVEVV